MVKCEIIYEPTGLVIGCYAFSNYPMINSVVNIEGHGKYLITRVEHVFNTSLSVIINDEYKTDIYVKKYS